MNHKSPLIHIDASAWLHAFRSITRATDARTTVSSLLPAGGLGHSATTLEYDRSRAVASSLVLANMNSLPLDWATRLSVGGVNMSYFIVKQLPVLPPEAYIETVPSGEHYVELVVPRVLELTYTSCELDGFARDLGYDGPPWIWDDERRHRLKCELDAIYAHMYGLDRDDLEWVLDPQEPSASFPGLKRAEEREFGEYRTQRYVLDAYDKMARGELPDLEPAASATGADPGGE